MPLLLYSGHPAVGIWKSPLTPKSSPQMKKKSPPTLKRRRMTISLEALPTGTVVIDKNGQHWKLGSMQTRDDQGILYEGIPCIQVGRCWAGPGHLGTQAKGGGNPF